MAETRLIPSWRDKIEYAEDGPKHIVLAESDSYKAVLVGLRAGLTIPPHPAATATYHVLEGNGVMIAGGEKIDLEPGATVVVPEGIPRGIEAESDLAILASHGSSGAPPVAQMPFKRMGIIGLVTMGAMVVLMVVLGRLLGNMNPMAAMMFPNGGDLGLGAWSVMIVPAAGLALMLGMMFFFYRSMKRATKGNKTHHHHH